MVTTAPSILAADHSTPEAFAQALSKVAEADFLHVDVMDGKFVKNSTLWNDAKKVLDIPSSLPKACHLMVQNPDSRYKEYFLKGVSMISVHIEVIQDVKSFVEDVHSKGIKAGLAINPDTPVEELYPYTGLIDYVLVMSVYPGASGKNYQVQALDKVKSIHQHKEELLIVVDGAMNLERGQNMMQAGAQVLVAGSSIFSSEDPAAVVEKFKKL